MDKKITNITWKGISYQSTEHCTIEESKKQIAISSTIVGTDEEVAFDVEYQIQTNRAWQMQSFIIKANVDGKKHVTKGKRNLDDSWTINDKSRPDLAHCIDIDISLTPLTNTLPINRLNLCLGEKQELDVLYFNVLKQEYKVAKQSYINISDDAYSYLNKTSNFESLIQVDKSGLVTTYPQLFERE